MEQYELDEVLSVRKRQMVKLIELTDLTKQLSQAVDNRDQISVQMLLSMRREPVSQLEELEQSLRRRLLEYPEEDAIRMGAILNGAEAESPQEEALCAQTARHNRMLEEVSRLDRQLSLRLGGGRSYYRMFRE